MSRGKFRLYQWDLKPERPIPVASQRLKERVVYRLEREWNGSCHSVDISPLPYFHQESLEDCYLALKAWVKGSSVKLPPALSFALSALDYAQAAKPLSGIWENTQLLTVDQKTLPSELGKVCKVKLTNCTLTSARDFLHRLVAINPKIRFRLDCNQVLNTHAFSDLQAFVSDFPVDYIEEPFAEISTLKQMARMMPIALDETLGRDPELDGLAKAWVLKPNLRPWQDFVTRLQDPRPIQKVLSNVFESTLSLRLYAHVYASYCAHQEPFGFGTAYYLRDENEEWSARKLKGELPLLPFAKTWDKGDLLWEF